jgi:glucosyl-dolichyl phosphate glucuronosyltransferase
MKSQRPDISVLVATRNRARWLEQMLSSLEEQTFEERSCELIVIDNGSVDDTQSVVKRKRTRFMLVALYEETAGKSRSLNRGLEVAAGDLLVFTDDDITASPFWLRSLYEAFEKYSSAAIFCGPIIPSFPPGTPDWMRTHIRAGGMFGRFDPNLTEGPLPAGMLPFGANFAVRSSAMQGMRFRLDLGPSEENGPLFGEDTDFLRRLRDKSPHIIFVPAARVAHHVTPSQIEFPALLERAFHLGRGIVISQRRSDFIEPLRFQVTPANLDFVQRIEVGGRLNYYMGQLHQLHLLGESSFDYGLLQALADLKLHDNLDLLGKSARLFYLTLR